MPSYSLVKMKENLMNPIWKSYQEKLGEGLAQTTLWLCTGLVLLGLGFFPSSNTPTRILLLGIGSVLFLLATIGAVGVCVRWFSSHKEVQPADTCLYCRRATGQVIDHLAPGNLTPDWAGREAYIFRCSNPKCGKTYGRQTKPPT